MTEKLIKWNKQRLFGVEFEFSADSTDRHRLKTAVESAGQRCDVRDWERSRDNTNLWIAKTDSSCGYELCSPPVAGPTKLKMVGDVIDKVFKSGAEFNNSCGLHVHIGCSDFSDEQMYSLLAHWIKIEMVIMHAHPASRLENPHCKTCNSKIHSFEAGKEYTGKQIFDNLRKDRKQTLNLYYWNERKSIEFRMGEMCGDIEDIKNRIRILIWFVDVCKIMPIPKNLNWFSPKQVLRFLCLCYDHTETTNKKFSPAIISMRNWLVNRLDTHIPSGNYDKDRDLIKSLKEEFHVNDEKFKTKRKARKK